MKKKDELIRFLLPHARARGAIIRGTNILAEAKAVHGLEGEPAELFGNTLLASMMLLSISKGGVRQVLQLDTTNPDAPIRRIQGESKSGSVRGFLQWQEEKTTIHGEGSGLTAWMGQYVLLSTVRDLGVGQPYVSTVQYDSDWLSDYIMEYLKQSVQIQADFVLQGDFAMMLEAMPGAEDEHWFSAVEAMAKISNARLATETPDQILASFEELGCQIVGRDDYEYACSCSLETMEAALRNLTEEELEELANEHGDVILSCQYCKNHVKVNVLKNSEEEEEQ